MAAAMGEAAAGRRRHAMVDGGGSWSAVVDGGDSLGGTRARARLASKGAAAAAEWDDRGEHDCINKVYYTVLYRLLA